MSEVERELRELLRAAHDELEITNDGECLCHIYGQTCPPCNRRMLAEEIAVEAAPEPAPVSSHVRRFLTIEYPTKGPGSGRPWRAS
jgi:hypothetical protein